MYEDEYINPEFVGSYDDISNAYTYDNPDFSGSYDAISDAYTYDNPEFVNSYDDISNDNPEFVGSYDAISDAYTYDNPEFVGSYDTPDLTPTSSVDVTAGMTPVELAALKRYMESQSNANTTGGGPGPATDYIGALVAAVKSGAILPEALKSLSAPVQAAVTKALTAASAATSAAAPNFLDKIGDFLKTDTGKAIGIGGLAALLGSAGNRGVGDIYKGYQGGIPNYSATRTMNEIPTTTVDASGNTVARRPGQGGITYFSPMRYTEASPATSNTPPAAGIAALPEANTASTAPAAGIAASSPAYSAPPVSVPATGIATLPEANTASTAPATGIAASAPAYSAPTLDFSTPNVPNMPPMAGPAPVPAPAPIPKEDSLLPGERKRAPTPAPPSAVGPDSPYYQSPEYKAYQEANSSPFGSIGTMDMYDSPYFGTVGSGSLGRQNDRAYESYLGRTAQSTPNVPNQEPVARAAGGLSSLGGYSDGGRGRLLRGPGDGVSDSIPAIIGKKQPARLADGEFVVPARIVSEIGNGSTEAGARKLYAMMDRVQKARGKTLKNVAANSRADKYLPV